MTGDESDRGRVEALDALRGLLALAVAAYHFFVFTHPFGGFARNVLVVLGIYAVQTFFIISGFCFFYLYADVDLSPRTWRGFYLKRFFRIAPLYYVVIALSPLLDAPVYPNPSIATVIENITLTFGFVHPNHAMIPGGWSIGVECVFYVLLPGMIWLTRPIGARIVLMMLLFALSVPGTFGGIESAQGHQRFHAYVAVANHGFLFLLGGVIADLRRATNIRLPPMATLVPATLLCLLVLWSSPFSDHLDAMVGFARVRYVAVVGLAVWVIAHLRTSHGMLHRVLRHLGDWSYAVYLMHPFSWLVVVACLPVETPGAITFVIGLVVTLVAAGFVHLYIEQPMLHLGRRLERRLTRAEHFHVDSDAQRA